MERQTKAGPPVSYVGVDVGKSSHVAFAVGAAGEPLFSLGVANRPGDIDRLLARCPGATVVVDQKRNIGALVVSRAHGAGNPVAYLPGIAMKRSRDMFPGVAKTDSIDAEVIARTAAGMPWTLRPVAPEPEGAKSLRMLASQRDFLVRERTSLKNRLRAALLEADPALEAAVDPSSPWQLAVLAEIGSAFDVAAAGTRRFRSVAERGGGASRERSQALLDAMRASASSGRPGPAAEGMLVRQLASRILGIGAEVAEIDAVVEDSLAGDEAYECLLTVPGVGPRTAAALVTLVDISLFRSHHELASFCGLAPADSQSGTSIRRTSPGRGGNKALKNLLIFSCNSLIGGGSRFGEYYRACVARGMRHNRALKATARKRLKVIYAVMRDKVPYRA